MVKNQVTLDLCGQTFASERLRVTRLQVAYLHLRPNILVSNEVVGYRPGGTQEAMSELRNVAAHCPSGPQAPTVVGAPTIAYRLQRLHIGGLDPGYVAACVHESAIENGIPHVAVRFAIYQTRGRVLSAIYVQASTSSLAQHVAERAAVQSSHNLTRG